MALLKLLLILANISLRFISVKTYLMDENSRNDSYTAVNYRLPDNVIPLHYDIKLIPYIIEDNFTFDGEISANIKIHHKTLNISLHALELTINEESTKLINNDGIVYTPTTHNYNNKTEILVLNFDNELSLGFYTLKMKYVGILNNMLGGFFRTFYTNKEGEKVWFAATHFEATSARRAFPCWDEPALKATFNISLKHHRNYTVLSNMPMREQSNDDNHNNTVWTYFDRTPLMSTYLVALVVSDFVRVPNADGTVNIWCRSEIAPYSKLVQEIAEKSGQFLRQYTNSSERVPKMDHVALPYFSFGGMENWGLITYKEENFIFKEETNTILRQRVMMTVAHEMAHQWFGNVVSPSWWSYVWLNEGFASFFQYYIIDKLFKNMRVMDIFVVNIQRQALLADHGKTVKAITAEVNSPEEIKSLFSHSSYTKGPAMLYMLQHIITHEVFQKGIIMYVDKYQFNSATPDDLWSIMQTALDESDVPHNEYKLKEVMDTWIKQKHYPTVVVSRNYETGETIMRQEHFGQVQEKDEIDNDKWWIPLTFATQTNPNFSNTVPSHWLTPQNLNISIDGIDPNDWIIVNLQQMGYYRVNYDLANWQKIADCLNSDEYTKIHVLNRAQIIDDASYFVMNNKLPLSMFLNLTNYLSRETDYIAWSSMFNTFYYLSLFFKLPESAHIKLHFSKSLNELIKDVGYEEDFREDNLTKMKRIEALKWACTFGHSECKEMANIKLSEHLANSEVHKISVNLHEWTYCNGLMKANASIWNKMMDMYIKKQDTKILRYLTCSEDLMIIINYFNMSVSNNSMIQDKDYLLVYENIVENHVEKDIVLDYILNYIMNLNNNTITRKIDVRKALAEIVINLNTRERLNKVNEFLENNFEDKSLVKFVQVVMEKIYNILSNQKKQWQYLIEN